MTGVNNSFERGRTDKMPVPGPTPRARSRSESLSVPPIHRQHGHQPARSLPALPAGRHQALLAGFGAARCLSWPILLLSASGIGLFGFWPGELHWQFPVLLKYPVVVITSSIFEDSLSPCCFCCPLVSGDLRFIRSWELPQLDKPPL